VFVSIIDVNIASSESIVCSNNTVQLQAYVGSILDSSMNRYGVTQIGNQYWTAQNIYTTSFSNGDSIPLVSGVNEWSSLLSSGSCSVNSDSTYDSKFGKLYNWYAVSDSRNLCPQGWRVPSLSDMFKLAKYIDNNTDTNSFVGLISYNVGGFLKSNDSIYWKNPNLNATNKFGFNAVGAGNRNGNGYFGWFREATGLWVTNEYTSSEGYFFDISGNSAGLGIFSNGVDKKGGFSVRCMKSVGNALPISYLWSTGDTTPTISVSPTQTTTYYCTVSNGISSCTDSVTITVKQTSTSTQSASACDSYQWYGNTYTSSGVYTFTTTNAVGCDSIATLNLTINPSSLNTTSITSCG
jgi:uncharacterized protein (TIGR02145 family)